MDTLFGRLNFLLHTLHVRLLRGVMSANKISDQLNEAIFGRSTEVGKIFMFNYDHYTIVSTTLIGSRATAYFL